MAGIVRVEADAVITLRLTAREAADLRALLQWGKSAMNEDQKGRELPSAGADRCIALAESLLRDMHLEAYDLAGLLGVRGS